MFFVLLNTVMLSRLQRVCIDLQSTNRYRCEGTRIMSHRTSRLLLATLLAVLFAVVAPLAGTAQETTVSSLLVKLVPGLSPEQQADVIARNGGVETSSIPALRLHVVAVPTDSVATVMANYQADAQVQHVELNTKRQSEAIPADALYSYQWALPKIGFEEAYGVIVPTGTAKVAVLDTGIDATHPDLAGNVIAGMSILDGSTGMTDPSGHGTSLAGIIAARTNNGLEGIAGVGYAGVRLMPVTVLNANGEGQDSDVIAGVIWAADHGADVILMAFSAAEFSQNLQDAIDYAWSKGVVIVAAVGNNAVDTPTFPAGDRGVMGVAATDAADAQAYFSNQGQAVFIAAPGVDIQTLDLNGNYVVLSGTSVAAAHVAGLAGLMKAVDPTLSNGVIVGRIARNADPAGTAEQTGNGRINMPRALADTSLEPVQPAGADPVGQGGPFVGPYRAANVKLVLSGGLNITAPPGASDKTINGGQSFTVQITISNQNNTAPDEPRTWSAITATLTVPPSWSKSADLSGASLGNATVGGSSLCGAGVTTTNCTYAWTVTAPNATSSGNDITVNIAGTPSGVLTCSGGNQCTDTAKIQSIAVVNPASLTITSTLAAVQQGSPGDTTVKNGDTIALSMTASNGAAPRAAAAGVAATALTVTQTGSASTICAAGAPASATIAAGASTAFTFACATTTGNGTLSFSASVNGTDENTGDPVSAGPSSSNTITVDNTAPTSGLSPAGGNVSPPFSFSWNITDPLTGGVKSDVKTSTCNVTVASVSVSTLCSGNHSLGAGAHTVVVSASDNAGNTLSDTRNYTVIAATTISAVSGSGTFGGTATLTATLKAGSTPLSGKTISFTLNGTGVGTATTDANGVATLTNVSLTGINAGTHSGAVGATFTADGTYEGSSGSGDLAVNRAATSLSAVGGTGTFGGTATLTATLNSGSTALSGKTVSFTLNGNSVGSATTDANGVATLSNVSLTGINAGTSTGAVGASFEIETNYLGSTGSGNLVVDRAATTTTVTVADAMYDGNPHGGSATVTGPGGLNQSLPVTYAGISGTVFGPSPTAPTDAGSYSATATYAETANYQGSSDTKNFTINKATPTVTVTGGTFPYDGNPHGATTAVTGVNGVTVAGSTTVNYAGVPPTSYGPSTTPPTDAGTYQARAVFTSANGNYANAQGTGSIVINKAIATTTVTVSNATYDTNPHGGTANVTGPGGLNQSLTVTYAGATFVGAAYGPSTTAPTDAGNYSATATYAETANYLGSTDTKNFTIAKATQSINFASLSSKYFLDPNFTVSATATSGLPVSFSADPTTPTICTVTTGGTVDVLLAGTCTIKASQSGNNNYLAAQDVSQYFTVTGYSWNGFFQPIDNGIYNRVKAGQAIPIKFSLNGNQSMNIFMAGSPSSQSAACAGGAAVDDIEEVDTAGASGLTYDPGTDQYHYVWKTEKGWGGSCRKLTVTLADGSVHIALFNFTK
jgi:subtilisin family serine protease